MKKHSSYILDGTGMSGEYDMTYELNDGVIANMHKRLVKNKWKCEVKTTSYTGEVRIVGEKKIIRDIENTIHVLENKGKDGHIASLVSLTEDKRNQSNDFNKLSVFAGGRRLFKFWTTKSNYKNKTCYFLNVEFSPTLAFSGQNRVALNNHGDELNMLLGVLMLPFKVLGSVCDIKIVPEKIKVFSVQLAVYGKEFEDKETRDLVLTDLYFRFGGAMDNKNKVSAADLMRFDFITEKTTKLEDSEGNYNYSGFALKKNKTRDNKEYPLVMLGIYAKDIKDEVLLKNKVESIVEEKTKKSDNIDLEEIRAGVKKNMFWDDKIHDKLSRQLRFDYTFFGEYFRPKGLSVVEVPKYALNLLETINFLIEFNSPEVSSTAYKSVMFDIFKLHSVFGFRKENQEEGKEEDVSFVKINYRELRNYCESKYPMFWEEFKNVNRKNRVTKLAAAVAADTGKTYSDASIFVGSFFDKLSDEMGYNISDELTPYSAYVAARASSIKGFMEGFNLVEAIDDDDSGSNEASNKLIDICREASKKSTKTLKLFLNDLSFPQIKTIQIQHNLGV
jgi:hypothetical protein